MGCLEAYGNPYSLYGNPDRLYGNPDSLYWKPDSLWKRCKPNKEPTAKMEGEVEPRPGVEGGWVVTFKVVGLAVVGKAAEGPAAEGKVLVAADGEGGVMPEGTVLGEEESGVVPEGTVLGNEEATVGEVAT